MGSFVRHPAMYMLENIAAVLDRPDDKAGAAHDIADREYAGQVGHAGNMVGADGAPAGDVEVGGTEQAR